MAATHPEELKANHSKALAAVKWMISKSKALHEIGNAEYESWQFKGNMPWYQVNEIDAAIDYCNKGRRALVMQWVGANGSHHIVCVTFPNQYRPNLVLCSYEVDFPAQQAA